jgi:hypothetical protein
VPIDDGKSTSHLMAATGEAVIETPDGSDLTAEQDAQLWAEAQPLFDQLKISNEDCAMWIPDLRDTRLLAGAAAAVIAAAPAQAVDNYVFGRCEISRPDSGAEIRPLSDAGSYLFDYHGEDPRYKTGLSSGEFFSGAKVTLIKAPAHGVVALADVPNVSNGQYHYMPNGGYVGKDRFVLQVEKNGVKVRIQYMIEGLDEEENASGWCNPETWKISSTVSTPAQENLQLASLLGNAAQGSNFSDLPGAVVGQTTGSQITLDTTAANYGWYIDYTPYLNDEYLPTSNPNE